MSMKVPAAIYGATMEAFRNKSLGCEEQLSQFGVNASAEVFGRFCSNWKLNAQDRPSYVFYADIFLNEDKTKRLYVERQTGVGSDEILAALRQSDAFIA